MTGWVALGLLSLASLAGLILVGRLPRKLWQVAAAAILLGMTGYAWQGRPATPAAPATPIEAENSGADAMLAMRADMDQTFGVAKRWLVTADSFARQGDYKLSAAFIQSGLRQYPRDADLWNALGLQLMLASDGRMSPPARLAFDKARENWPRHPGPDYFEGLTDLFARDIDGAIAHWEAALAKGTPKGKWRPRLESQLTALKALRAEAEMQTAPPAQSR